MNNEQVNIQSRDYWFKIVEFLQHNWALIDPLDGGGVCIYFIHDASGVFDRLHFKTRRDAERALRRNGFELFSKDSEAKKFIGPPRPPFFEDRHPNGLIYSSGKYWK